MKKLLTLGAIAMAAISYGQRVQKGDSQINAGVGLGNSWGGIPIYAGIDYGVHNDITIGAHASFSSKSETLYYTYKWRWFSVGANANYHFNSILNIPNNWDLYAGLSLVYNSVSLGSKDVSYPSHYDSSIFGFNAQVGARYYFSNNFGINVEFGGGDFASGGKAGISYKF